MRLYFDCCCYNRPFDDQSQDRIHDESEAILSIMKRCCQNPDCTVLGSTILNMEFAKITDTAKKDKITSLARMISETVTYTQAIKKRAIEIQKIELIRKMDSLHIASAESGNADVFLSTDDKLLKACQRMQDQLKVDVKNPIYYLAEVNEHDGCES